MQIDVTVVLRGTTKKIAAWRCEIDQDKQVLTADRSAGLAAPEDAWRRLSFDINRLAAQNPDAQVDVFLVLEGRLVESLYEKDALTEVVSYARDYTWGGNIYVAWEQQNEATFNRLYRGNEKILESLFSLLVKSGVTDLIELPKRRKAGGPNKLALLYECAAESVQRRARLRELVDDEGWRVVLRDEAYFIADFIREFVRGELGLAEGSNRAVFYDQRPDGGWVQLLQKARLYGQGGKLFVAAALSRSNHKDVRDLEELWGQESPGSKLILFNGIFEWLYTFARLCQANCPQAAPVGGAPHDDIIWVETARSLTPKVETQGRAPRLLVTSAFALRGDGDNYFGEFEGGGPREAQEEDEAYCLTATREIGGVLRHLPFHVAVEVRQRVTCEQMPGFLEGEPFTAWLYIGHGDRERGLREEQLRQYASPQRWINSFEDYEARLRLVILSACESAGLARLFVESGVAHVAIGFERKVLVEATDELSEKVMPAALRGGGGRDAVLDAFREAVRRLRRTSYLAMNKPKRHSDAGPKAFAAEP